MRVQRVARLMHQHVEPADLVLECVLHVEHRDEVPAVEPEWFFGDWEGDHAADVRARFHGDAPEVVEEIPQRVRAVLVVAQDPGAGAVVVFYAIGLDVGDGVILSLGDAFAV